MKLPTLPDWFVGMFGHKPKGPQASVTFEDWFIAQMSEVSQEGRNDFLRVLKYQSALVELVFTDTVLRLLTRYMRETNTQEIFFDDIDAEAKNILQAVRIHFSDEMSKITE